jgi:hypothetical protein
VPSHDRARIGKAELLVERDRTRVEMNDAELDVVDKGPFGAVLG